MKKKKEVYRLPDFSSITVPSYVPQTSVLVPLDLDVLLLDSWHGFDKPNLDTKSKSLIQATFKYVCP